MLRINRKGAFIVESVAWLPLLVAGNLPPDQGSLRQSRLTCGPRANRL
jgi:hypothetical protein